MRFTTWIKKLKITQKEAQVWYFFYETATMLIKTERKLVKCNTQQAAGSGQ